MRKLIKKPASEYAQKLAINRLAELAAQGHTPSAVLEQSIFNCWQGLFEVRVCEKKPGAGPSASASGAKVSDAARKRNEERTAKEQGRS